MIDIAPIIQETLDAKKPFKIPDGEHYIGQPVYLRHDDVLIYGSHPTNNGNTLWTDKPIDMFRVEGKIERPNLVGFTAEYRGAHIFGNECAVLRLGGWGEEKRYGVLRGNFDFDVYGDRNYMRSRWNWRTIEHPTYGDIYIHWRNPNFDFAKEKAFDNVDSYTCSYTGGGAHGIFIDYDSPSTERTSWIHNTKIRGKYHYVNTAIKAVRGDQTPINSLDVELYVHGAKTFFFLKGVNRSQIAMFGQNDFTRYTEYDFYNPDESLVSWEEECIPYFYADEVEKVTLDYMMWDRKNNHGRSEHGGFIRGRKLVFNGWRAQGQKWDLHTLIELDKK